MLVKRGGLQRVPVVKGASLLAICDLRVVLARRLAVGPAVVREADCLRE